MPKGKGNQWWKWIQRARWVKQLMENQQVHKLILLKITNQRTRIKLDQPPNILLQLFTKLSPLVRQEDWRQQVETNYVMVQTHGPNKIALEMLLIKTKRSTVETWLKQIIGLKPMWQLWKVTYLTRNHVILICCK